MMDSESAPAPQDLSKRAARRLIQRAVALVGRDRRVRQHVREARLSMLWILEDWGLEWTVILDRGEIRFDRRPVKKPDVILAWREAEVFFASARSEKATQDGFSIEGGVELHRYAKLIWNALRPALSEVLRFPFDDDGVRLA